VWWRASTNLSKGSALASGFGSACPLGVEGGERAIEKEREREREKKRY
jgi:hypothetical protein